MVPLQERPPHIRRRIVLVITSGVGLILIVILVMTFLHPKKDVVSKDGSPLRDFYTTILTNTQSYFSSK